MTTSASPWKRALPLSVWATLGTLSAGLSVLLAVVVGLAVVNRLDRNAAYAVLGFGLFMALLIAFITAAMADRSAAGLRALRAEAARRLEDPTARALQVEDTEPLGLRRTVEVRELARILDALQLRVRVADDVAEQHRRIAEHAGAGMFELLSGLVAAEEGARGQLAAELHDTVAQSLMRARQLMGDPSQADEVGDLVIDAEEQLRAVMARTRPAALREGDLATAICQMRDDFSFRYAVDVDISWPEQPYRLPLVTAITVYRFFQEAVLNVVKHADVETCWLSLDMDADGLVARVRDEGEGFDPGQVRPHGGRHVGLGLLRERARLAGGEVRVVSAPGAGTSLSLHLPATACGMTADGPGAQPRLRLDSGTTPGSDGGRPAIDAISSQ